MARGRTVNKYRRVYINGYDLSGYARNIGPLATSWEEGIDDPMTASVKGIWMGQPTISAGTFNGIFDNTATTGIHALASATAGTSRNVMVVQGIQAVPALGDPVFCGQFRQDDYITGPGDTPNTVTLKFSPWSSSATSLAYAEPWGILLHANTAETTDNTANGIQFAGTSDVGETLLGGWMMYQVTAGAGAGGTANIKIQDCDTVGGAYSDLLATGLIDVGTAPVSGVVALAKTAHVQEFVRWQVAFGTATSVTFTLAFMRNFVS